MKIGCSTVKAMEPTAMLVLGFYQGTLFEKVYVSLDRDLRDAITQLIKISGFDGSKNSVEKLYFREQCVLFLGLGKKKPDAVSAGKLGRRLYAVLAKDQTVRHKALRSASVLLEEVEETSQNFLMNVAVSFLEESLPALGYKHPGETHDAVEEGKATLETVCFLTDNAGAFDAQAANDLGDAVNCARRYAEMPSNLLYPEVYAQSIEEQLAPFGVEVEIWNERTIQKRKMGALSCVAQGSLRMPRVVTMRWKGEGDNAPVALVGKGVTFDSGGISLKPSKSMEEMKFDMCGSAVVVGAMQAIAKRGLRKNVVGVVGLVENMPSGSAIKPGDIVTSMSGKTIEVNNTDAEGRLVLADLLTYVQRDFSPTHVIDLATLTGAVVVALGNVHAGLFSNDDEMAAELTRCGLGVGERLWRLPMDPEYDAKIDSYMADVANTSFSGGAGTITAAHFLGRFVDSEMLWAHIDIAGVSWKSLRINESYRSTGYGVRLLYHFIKQLERGIES